MQKILFFIKTPPPLHGAAIINKYVLESSLLRNRFAIRAIEIHYVKNVKELGKYSKKKLKVIFFIWLRLFRELLFNRPDLVYFQISPLGLAFIRDVLFVTTIKLLNVRIVYHLHGLGIRTAAEKNRLYRLLYRFIFNKENVICLSKSVTSDIKNVYRHKPFIVNNALSDSTTILYKKFDSPVPHILFVSNLFKSKGIFDLIEAIYILKNKKLAFYLTIVGEEGDVSIRSLQNILYEKGLSNQVACIGPKYDEEKEELFHQTDLFVHPTLNDSWGLVVLEAMRAGLPVIATYEGSIPEIVDENVTGFLVEKNNPKELADRIEMLILNAELRDYMGNKGREKYLSKYTLEHFERNMFTVFETIFNDRNK